MMDVDSVPPPPSADLPPPPPSESFPPPPPASDSIPGPPTSDGPLPPSQSPVAKKKPVATEQKKAIPSMEEMLKKKREADEAASKPKFLSRKERERIALEKRHKEVEVKRAAATAAHTQSNGFTSRDRVQEFYSRSNGSNGQVPTGPRSMGAPPTGPRSSMAPPAISEAASAKTKSGDKRPSADSEVEQIRQRYMGAEVNQSKFSAKKKRRRTTEKKFNFEWNAEEDTSIDHNPIYASRIETNFFGRGHLGGLDTGNKTQEYAKALRERDREGGTKRAQEMIQMEQQKLAGSRRTTLDKHWSEKKLTDMRERDWRIFKEDFNISTKGGGIPNPMRNWGESNLPKRILDIVEEVGYTEPSPVQRAAIPIAMQARDLIGIAVTGSGKTAAFLLPLLTYISELPPMDENNRQDGPYAIILAPTRELAQQIEGEAKKFATPLGFNCVSVVGGHAIEEQVNLLAKGPEIVIATPGRLVDCLERRVLMLNQCCYVIMDEADRMIDMGFEEPVNKILDALPVKNEKPDTQDAEDGQAMSTVINGTLPYRQTMMYTATMPAAVERIARKYLRRPAIVTIGNVGEAVDTVEQRVEFVGNEDRRKKRLSEILNSGEFQPPIIVFVNAKQNCDSLARYVRSLGYSAGSMHGSKTQEQREAALLGVREGQTDVLVATDLVGRGIDVINVSLVVQFNMATSIEQYTHRIGRTGRAGKSGVAITFLGVEDNDNLYDLKQMLMKSEISKVPEELKKHEAAQQRNRRGGRAHAAVET